jgi:Phage tail tube protein
MANKNLRAGTLSLKVNGEVLDAVGNFDYSLGTPKREAIVGADRVHGFKEVPQVPYVEGEITDRQGLDLRTFFDTQSATVTLQLRNGKTILLREAWYAGDAKVSSETGAVAMRFEGLSAEEV